MNNKIETLFLVFWKMRQSEQRTEERERAREKMRKKTEIIKYIFIGTNMIVQIFFSKIDSHHQITFSLCTDGN